jgi:chromosome condensin MukBEF complex kleisin-like MukF subunit
MANITPQQQRADFKDAYYVSGDKLGALTRLSATIVDKQERAALQKIVKELYEKHDQLKKWADNNLKNWD